MNNEFNDYSQTDDTPLGSTEALQIHLEEYARRLNTAISRMRTHSYRVNFVVDNSIAAEIQELADLEHVTLSEMCSRLLMEHMSG